MSASGDPIYWPTYDRYSKPLSMVDRYQVRLLKEFPIRKSWKTSRHTRHLFTEKDSLNEGDIVFLKLWGEGPVLVPFPMAGLGFDIIKFPIEGTDFDFI